jgi:hypothetical protein
MKRGNEHGLGIRSWVWLPEEGADSVGIDILLISLRPVGPQHPNIQKVTVLQHNPRKTTKFHPYEMATYPASLAQMASMGDYGPDVHGLHYWPDHWRDPAVTKFSTSIGDDPTNKKKVRVEYSLLQRISFSAVLVFNELRNILIFLERNEIPLPDTAGGPFTGHQDIERRLRPLVRGLGKTLRLRLGAAGD